VPCITRSSKPSAAYVGNVATKDFNGVSLFSGSTLNVTTDSDGNTFSNVGINLGATSYSNVTDGTTSDVTSVANAKTALTNVKGAIDQLAKDRANIGSNIESLTYYSGQLSSLNNNLAAAKSRITDVDVATESTNYAKQNILVQSGTAMLAQAKRDAAVGFEAHRLKTTSANAKTARTARLRRPGQTWRRSDRLLARGKRTDEN